MKKSNLIMASAALVLTVSACKIISGSQTTSPSAEPSPTPTPTPTAYSCSTVTTSVEPAVASQAWNTNSDQRAQSFVVDATSTLVSAEFEFMAVGSPINVTAKLWEGGALPGEGTLLATTSLTGADTNLAMKTFVFSSLPTVRPGVTYFISLEPSGQGSWTIRTGDPYPGGNYYLYVDLGSFVWANIGGQEMVFKINLCTH